MYGLRLRVMPNMLVGWARMSTSGQWRRCRYGGCMPFRRAHDPADGTACGFTLSAVQ